MPSKTATRTSNLKAALNQASGTVHGKNMQNWAIVEDVDDLDLDGLNDHTSNPPRNPNHNLEAANKSINNSNPASEIISVSDNEDKMDDNTDLEAAEESAETELGRKSIFVSN